MALTHSKNSGRYLEKEKARLMVLTHSKNSGTVGA
jgi:hypothetical protein